MTSITIELDERDVLKNHIETIQAAMTRRNKEIEALKAKLEAGEGSPHVREAHDKGYEEGYKACAAELRSGVQDMVRALGKIDQSAWDQWLRQERPVKTESREFEQGDKVRCTGGMWSGRYRGRVETLYRVLYLDGKLHSFLFESEDPEEGDWSAHPGWEIERVND